MTFQQTASLSHAPWAIWPWLRLPASLTAALRRTYGGEKKFPLAVLTACGRGRPRENERQRLGIHRGERVFWREVLLHGPDPCRPAVQGRTVFPLRAISRGLRPLTRHGNRPIGNTLFRHRRLRRSPIRITASPAEGPRRKWQRSSILVRGKTRIFIKENFLEDLPPWQGKGHL